MQLNSTVKTYATILLLTIIALVFIKAFDISYPISVSTTTKSRELAVVGEGKVDVVPDTAVIDAGIVVANAASVEEAQSSLNKTNNSIVSTMQKLGVKKEDIKTSNYSVYPNQSYDPGNQGKITGYNGNVTVSIKVRNIESLGQVIETVTQSGANQIQNTSYTIDNPEKYREEARNKAIENAESQAKRLAQKLGIKLGKVVNIVESTPNTAPQFLSAERQFGGGGAPDIQPGSQTITSVVTLYFEKR